MRVEEVVCSRACIASDVTPGIARKQTSDSRRSNSGAPTICENLAISVVRDI